MHLWKPIVRTMFALVLLSAALLTPLAASAQDASADPAYDYSDLQITNSSAVTSMATPQPGEATPAASEEHTGTIIGDPDAPVTMVIYADYQCPHCRDFHADIEPRIINDFVRTGMVKLELVDFPVIGMESVDDVFDDSKESVQAAEAASCAAEQDAFMPYREALYAGTLQPNSGALSNDTLMSLANELGLDSEAFGACLESGRYEEFIHTGLSEGLDKGISSTPSFIINGEVTMLTNGGYEPLADQLNEAYENAR